ncbi:metal ABC transporter solute-binding protein, Zn/Mn family [Marispirochaeta sp.]|jgi:zinc transport system substrate-binding protein|uniref:metal ABC transporter solute-binding protein, Zn/Mn family n=1 Tax=Marispirochaeta sp. TaxID=2038653 RepID=UPI0029C659CC|nr:zinc ABC transporter substrate-binding protein [Marispirochaeta sp.]
MKRILFVLLCLFFGFGLFAEGAQETSDVPGIIATTSWTASFAEVAGLENIHILAPYELQHPPEYEMTPGDIRNISRAKMIIYAGYEVMMERLKEAASTDAQLVQITTVNTWPVINESVRIIAQAAGTQETAEANLKEIEEFFSDWRAELIPYKDTPVIVHKFLEGLAKNLGLTVAGTYGPAPLEAKQLKELSESGAAVIIDNWHTDVGAPLLEIMPGAGTASLINFPGKDGTRTLMDVLQYSRRELTAAFQ